MRITAPKSWLIPELIPIAHDQLVEQGFEKKEFDNQPGAWHFNKNMAGTLLCQDNYHDWQERLLETIEFLADHYQITAVEWFHQHSPNALF